MLARTFILLILWFALPGLTSGAPLRTTTEKEPSPAVADTIAPADSSSSENGEADDEEGGDEKSSSLTIAGSYISHVSYRGRDNGVSQQAWSPSLRYDDRTGVFAFGSVYWLSGGSDRWDQASLGAGYTFSLSDDADLSFSYSHFWFSDSSTLSRSLLDNAIDASLQATADPIEIHTDLEMDFSSESEWSWTVALSYPFSLAAVDFDPGVRALLGEQNGTLVLERIGRMNIHGRGRGHQGLASGTATATNSFGIMGYEVTLPASISLGSFSLDPSLTYVIPVNVVDESRPTPYLFAQVDLSLTLP